MLFGSQAFDSIRKQGPFSQSFMTYQAIGEAITMAMEINMSNSLDNSRPKSTTAYCCRAANPSLPRAYYATVKTAAQNNAAGAKVMAVDLSERFAGQGKSTSSPSNPPE